jgi:hypothetical protein
MKIQDNTGGVVMEIGDPDLHNIKIYMDVAGIVTFNVSSWEIIKQKIDKMIKMTRELQ